MQLAILATPTAKIFNDAYNEIIQQIQKLGKPKDRDSSVALALLSMKAMQLGDALNESIKSSVCKQLPTLSKFLKDLWVKDYGALEIASPEKAYDNLDRKIHRFKALNGGAEWVEVREDPSLGNAISKILERSGWSFSALTSDDSSTVTAFPKAKGATPS